MSGKVQVDPIRVLHLEDDLDDGQLVAIALEKAGLSPQITRVTTRDGFVSAFRPGGYDLILSDFSLPDFDGLSALSHVRAQDTETPFIFVSGTIGEDRAVGALRDGATDYILKDRLSRLVAAVKRSLEERHEREARRAAEERIREQAALLDEAREAIVVQDLDKRVTYWSRGAQAIYGWTAAEALAGGAAARLPLRSQHEADAGWQAALRDGKWDGTLKQVTRDGREIVVETHWTCLRRPDGTARAVLSISSDVTQARQLENQLLRAQRLETVGMIASGVAHDLNNVLSPILLGIVGLRRRATDDTGRRLLDAMETSAERGADIVRQVVTFARGGGEGSGTVDACKVVRTLEPLLAATFPKSVALQLELPNDLEPVEGDATQLQQVLLNLCVNARDAMPRGGRLLLRAENVDSPSGHPGKFVCFRVADSGEGIPKDIQAKIFEPFYTTKSKGTGIGLATVASIIKRHGGFIELDSEPGRGTEFRVYLPAGPRSAAPRPAVAPSGAGRLLVVDRGSLREILKGTLEAYGYRVLSAEDIDQAFRLHALHRAEIAAVLINVSLPELHGADLIRGLVERDPQLKVIDTSGEVEGLQGHGLETLVRAILPKPYTTEKLLEVVRQVVEKG
jgi:PAS domain S-box-containing protein